MEYTIKCKIERALIAQKEIGNKISKVQLAKALGVSKQSISNYVSGKYLPTLDKALKMAQLLNCKVDDIYELVEESEPE